MSKSGREYRGDKKSNKNDYRQKGRDRKRAWLQDDGQQKQQKKAA